MVDRINLACQLELITLDVAKILPVKSISSSIRKSIKYLRIAASIQELGIIEPPVVYPDSTRSGFYMLLDGHVRLDILKHAGTQTVDCLVTR